MSNSFWLTIKPELIQRPDFLLDNILDIHSSDPLVSFELTTPDGFKHQVDIRLATNSGFLISLIPFWLKSARCLFHINTIRSTRLGSIRWGTNEKGDGVILAGIADKDTDISATIDLLIAEFLQVSHRLEEHDNQLAKELRGE